MEGRLTAGRAALYGLVVVICLMLVTPSLIVIPMSFSGSRFLEFPPSTWSLQWYQAFITSVEWNEATWMSAAAALLTTVLATSLGTLAAYGLHVSESRWAATVRTLLILPLIVPAILIGVGVFFFYAWAGLNNTLGGVTLAHTMLALPYVMITVTAGLKCFDMNQEKVARSLGASRARAFVGVTLPQIRFSILAGAVFAFITSLDEVVVTIFIARGDKSTLPRRMFSSLRDEVDPTIAAISTLLIAVSIVMLLIYLFAGQRGPRRPAAAP